MVHVSQRIAVTVVFDFTKNPFFVLGVTHFDKASEVDDFADEAKFEGTYTEDKIESARSELVLPNKRLIAELSLLPGQSKAQLQTVFNSIKMGSKHFDAAKYAHYTTLSRINLLTYSLSKSISSSMILAADVVRIIELWGELAVQTVTLHINEARLGSGFPQVSEEAIKKSLKELQQAHAVCIAQRIWDRDDRGPLMEAIVESVLSRNGLSRSLTQIVAEYDSLSEPVLVRIEQKIDAEIEVARRFNEETSAATQRIAVHLSDWDVINQAVQRVEQIRGHEEGRSKRVYEKVRALSVSLVNDADRVDEAAQLTKVLLETFPELETVAASLRDDIETLGGSEELTFIFYNVPSFLSGAHICLVIRNLRMNNGAV